MKFISLKILIINKNNNRVKWRFNIFTFECVKFIFVSVLPTFGLIKI